MYTAELCLCRVLTWGRVGRVQREEDPCVVLTRPCHLPHLARPWPCHLELPAAFLPGSAESQQTCPLLSHGLAPAGQRDEASPSDASPGSPALSAAASPTVQLSSSVPLRPGC